MWWWVMQMNLEHASTWSSTLNILFKLQATAYTLLFTPDDMLQVFVYKCGCTVWE